MTLDPLLAHIEPEGDLPPVDSWHPARRGELDLCIAADGRWFHEGAVIARPRLVRLLSTLLRREADGDYLLVTPVEAWRIRVEDRPFLAVDGDREADGHWWLTTNVGDRVCLDATSRLTLSEARGGQTLPEVPVRFGLAARLGRNLYYRLVEAAESRPLGDLSRELGLSSGGAWHPLGRLDGDGEAPCA